MGLSMETSLIKIKIEKGPPRKDRSFCWFGKMLFKSQAIACWNNSTESMVTAVTASFATDKTATCEFFKAPFRYTAPIVTDTGEKPRLLKSGLLKYHHLSVTRWTWDLNKGLGIVSDRKPANEPGSTN